MAGARVKQHPPLVATPTVVVQRELERRASPSSAFPVSFFARPKSAAGRRHARARVRFLIFRNQGRHLPSFPPTFRNQGGRPPDPDFYRSIPDCKGLNISGGRRNFLFLFGGYSTTGTASSGRRVDLRISNESEYRAWREGINGPVRWFIM